MNSAQFQIMQVVQKLSVFKGFEMQDVARLLKICQSATFRPGEQIYGVGEASDEMLILLRGKLSVIDRSGEVLAVLPAGSATGEMGLFTGQPRSASIVAADTSSCLLIRKAELIALMSNNPVMHVKLLYNIIRLLSERVAQTNRLNAELMQKLARLEGDDDDEEDAYDPADEEEDEEYVEVDDDDDIEHLEVDGGGAR